MDATPFDEAVEPFTASNATVTENGMDISHFFERPLLLDTFEWDDNTDFFEVSNYWTKYFTHRAIWPKLLGFSRMTANLEVEFRINGSPFKFGDILVSYRPLFSADIDNNLSGYSGGYLPEDGNGCSTVGFPSVDASSNAMTFTARSQRQSCYLIISQSIGAKMVLPFIYPFEAMRVNSLQHDPSNATELANMKASVFYKSLAGLGSITMESLSTLRNTQAAGVGVTIDVFVRAINVNAWLASGVAALKPQGKVKGKGSESIKPSDVSTAVAVGARAFKDIPVIGPLATVGSLVAEGVSTVLKAFGFTPMPINAPISPVAKVLSFLQSSLFAPRSIEPLCLDHQNQVSIDPTIIGGPPIDELSFASFCSRSSIGFLTYFGASCGPTDTIAAIPVHPMMGHYEAVSAGDCLPALRYQLLPCALAAMNFRYWRGTMVLKLRAIKTNFHRGRLRVIWEPEIAGSRATGPASILDNHEGYQQMLTWDLSASDCVEMKVGFGARSGRLTVPPLGFIALTGSASWKTNTASSSGPISGAVFGSDNYLDYLNGFIRVTVLNRLQAPDTTYPLPIVVSISFEDLELYDPVDCGVDAHVLNTPSGLVPYNASGNPDIDFVYKGGGGMVSQLATRRMWPDGYYPQGSNEESTTMFEFQPSTSIDTLVYEGELVTSFRALAARETYYDTLVYEVPTSKTTPQNASSTVQSSLTIPPCIFTTLIPWRPTSFGTVGPARSTVFTENVGAPQYSMPSASGANEDFYPSMNRTPLSVIIQECFVGQRGSYNWKFLPGPSYGVDIQNIFVSRSNALGSYNRVGSYPSPSPINSYLNGVDMNPDDTSRGFHFSAERRTNATPLAYDTGNFSVKAWSVLRNTRSNISLKLSTIRYLLGGLVPSFAAGGICATLGERLMAGIRFPYFSIVKFLPGSSTGWMCPYGNAEMSSNMRLTIITRDKTAATTCGGVLSTDANWTWASGLPSRAYVSVYMVGSVGDDWSVSNFVNVPALFINYPNGLDDAVQVDS